MKSFYSFPNCFTHFPNFSILSFMYSYFKSWYIFFIVNFQYFYLCWSTYIIFYFYSFSYFFYFFFFYFSELVLLYKFLLFHVLGVLLYIQNLRSSVKINAPDVYISSLPTGTILLFTFTKSNTVSLPNWSFAVVT